MENMPHDPTCSLLSGKDGCDCSLSKSECHECEIIGRSNCPDHGAPSPQTEAVGVEKYVRLFTQDVPDHSVGVTGHWFRQHLNEFVRPLTHRIAELENERDSWKEMTQQRIQQVITLDNQKAAAEARVKELERDKERLVEHFIDRANCAANNMEGENEPDFSRYETRMVCAVETLEVLGFKYNPITGKRSAIQTPQKP